MNSAAQEVQAFLDRVRGRSLEPEKASVHFYHGGWESIELAKLQALVNAATLKELAATPVPGPQFPIRQLDCSVDDDGGWNLEGSGLCSIDHFSAALEAWYRCVRGSISDPLMIPTAAAALGATMGVIIQAGIYSGMLHIDASGQPSFHRRVDRPENFGLFAAIQLISCAHGDDEGSMPVADVAAYLNVSPDVIDLVVPAAGLRPSVMYIDKGRIVHKGVD